MKYELAGYIAFLRACSPTAKRLGQQMLAGAVEPIAYGVGLSNLDKADYLSKELKRTLREAYQEREIKIKIDRDFAHAQGISILFKTLHRCYCSHWLVLVNETNTPFITSDSPAILYREDIHQQWAQKYIPLKPSLALLIAPDFAIERPGIEDVRRYKNDKDAFGVVKQSYVRKFNEAIVKNAERIVLHQKKADWVEQLVCQFRMWRTEAIVSHLPTDKGTWVITRPQAVERNC